ncbi:MAG: AI-2E family transporter [Myxococcota bacterium]
MNKVVKQTESRESVLSTQVDALLAIRRRLTGILFLALFALAYFAQSLILPIVLGVLIALTFSPLVRSASRLGIPAAFSASLIVIALIYTLGALILVMGGTASTWIDDTPRYTQELRSKLTGVLASMEAVQEVSDEVEDLTTDDDVQQVVIERPELLTSVASNAMSFAMSLAVGLILALFLLASGDLFYVKLVQTFRRMEDKKRALEIVYGIERRISHYLLAITAINAGLGVAITVAMYLIGMPYPYVWGLIAFAFNYVPILGAMAGTIASAAVAILTFDTLSYAVIAPLAYWALTTFEGQFMTPMLLGRRLKLNTVSVFLTLIFWGWLWGIPGALLAVPVLVAVKVIADNFDRLEPLSNFLAGRKEQTVKS